MVLYNNYWWCIRNRKVFGEYTTSTFISSLSYCWIRKHVWVLVSSWWNTIHSLLINVGPTNFNLYQAKIAEIAGNCLINLFSLWTLSKLPQQKYIIIILGTILILWFSVKIIFHSSMIVCRNLLAHNNNFLRNASISLSFNSESQIWSIKFFTQSTGIVLCQAFLNGSE